ncbi:MULTISPECIES: MarR family winged helix-turn-helix transcriptional regulator [Microbispora]|uniref:MarR family transcriptional regulator n=1 Tax=Microbispora siamensis TaxID=564413 RepID=A0ABQ4GF87_9ACTN|nr:MULTISPECIES: MarR family transcriptional regulator [Microbispora]OPG14611.1 hypothetical protein B1L11_00020 [Microbispora sp. GKU 823]GIH60071.1 MarR family transcriptional regulator [Microbispora siamensis]
MEGDGRLAAPVSGPLATSVCWLLGDAARELTQELERVLRKDDLRWRDYGVLVVLEAAGPLSQQEIGRRLSVDRSTMVHVIDVLEERGLVARARDAADRRAYSIRLTDSGRALLVDVLHPATEAVQERVLGGLAAEDRMHLNRVLAQLAAGR